MTKRNPRKRKRTRDSAEKRLREFLTKNPGIGNEPGFYTALFREGINISAERVVQIKHEMKLLKRRRRK